MCPASIQKQVYCDASNALQLRKVHWLVELLKCPEMTATWFELNLHYGCRVWHVIISWSKALNHLRNCIFASQLVLIVNLIPAGSKRSINLLN